MNGTLGCFCEQQFTTYNVLILFMKYREDGLDQDADAYNEWYENKSKKSGWYDFELYKNNELIEKNKFFLQKD